jgi:hypothetical protein
MWMGGNAPFGYDKPKDGTRKLEVNEAEAATVRQMFKRYLQLGSVHALERELASQGVVSKLRVYSTGRTSGGIPFSRGSLFHLLRNRIYLGLIIHKDQTFEGQHDGIVDAALFERVGSMLNSNASRHCSADKARATKAPLTGKLFDADGEAMSPSFSRGRTGQLYRYYVSTSIQKGGGNEQDGTLRRIAASAIETTIRDIAARWLPREENPLDHLMAVRLTGDGLILEWPTKYASEIARQLSADERILHTSAKLCQIEVPVTLPLRGGQRLIIAEINPDIRPDPTLIAALRRAHSLLRRDRKGMPILEVSPPAAYDRNLIRLAFIAPDLQRDIIKGHQPASLNLQKLVKMDIPLCWKKQRKALDWPA